ncbi:MAG: hypothetical protein AABX27_02530 [Nanoarchaeota archaeon]|mgnify:CR=1 FL=1
MTLYKTLNEICEEDISHFSAQQQQDISDDISAKVGKKIGASEYQKLEQFVMQNKDEPVMKELVGNIVMPLVMKFMLSNLDEAKIEKLVGYGIATKLYECLSKSNYDLDQALLDL